MASFKDEPAIKKRRTEDKGAGDGTCDEDLLFSDFHSKFLDKNPLFIEEVDKFKDEILALGAFKISSCNAADPDNGYPFTKANCTLRPTQSKFAFSNFFTEGLKILKNFITDKDVPGAESKRIALKKLVQYLLNEEIKTPLAQLKKCGDETELTVLLAFHLFCPLSPSSHFSIDKNKANKQNICCCGQRHGKITYSDTSIGNLDVWHGYLDLIMEGADVAIDVEIYKDIDSAVEVKNKQFDLCDSSAGSSIAQLAAETIVYSFYFRMLHQVHGQTLVPCIGVSNTGLVFYFYDCVNDVLLGSTHFPLASSLPFQLNFRAIIAVWLVLNHKNFCGISVSDLKDIPKANFLGLAKEKIEIYQKALKRGHVGTKHFQPCNLDPVAFVNAKFFVKPEEI